MGVRNAGLNLFAGIPPLTEDTTGRVFFVGNSSTYVPGGIAGVDDTSHGDTPYRPFATLDYAVSQCTAGRSDVIYILPGHAETIATATALDIDIAGVRITGLGVGSNRPTFTVATAATATITFSAANTTTKNIVVICNLDGLNTAITVTGADVTLDIEYRDTSATVEADIAITASGARFICKLRDIGFSTGDQREASISMNGVVGARIDIDQYGLVNTAVVNFVTTLCSDVEVRGTTRTSVTDGSRNVVDTITGSLWYMDIIDAAAGARYTGGSAAAVASDDISAINTVLGTIASAAATGAVTSTDVAMAYIKQLVTQMGLEADTDPVSQVLSGTNGITTWKSGTAPATGVSISEALRFYGENVIVGTGTALPSNSSLYGVLAGATGVATFPEAAHPADAVSLAEVMRSIWARNIAGINPLGTVIFVASSGGSDVNIGTSPNAPKATIASAAAAAGAGGTIVLGPGTHNVDVSVAALTPLANQQFVSAIPSFGGAPRAVIANDADDGANIVLVDVDGTVWRDIEFRNVTAATTCVTQVSVSQTTAVRGIHFENCWFNQNALDGAMISVAMNDATNATTGAVFKHCRFTGATGTTSVVVYIQVGVGGITRSLIEDCMFECQSADGDARAIDFLDPGPGGTSSYAVTIRHNDFVGPTDGGNDAVPISVAAAMTRDEIIPAIRNNYFHQCSTAPITIDKFNESTINNYVGDSATGGTLVDPGT